MENKEHKQSTSFEKRITIGSLFDGSGGFPLAGVLNGAIPLWASEIEPYPIAVTRSRFPSMKHLGSVTDVHGDDIEPVDIITFGSPCQDMSIAGKRAGMQHESKGDEDTTRSGLFYEAVRIIKEMREKTNGEYPKYAIWENVPGAFTSNKGEDFRFVLQELAQVADGDVSIPRPKDGRWNNAGEIVGDGFSIAWRVLDAQYWGVPQRRKRIYLVADFADKRAGKVLFERESVSGNPSQSREEGKETPTNIGESTERGCISFAWANSANAGLSESDKCSPTIKASQGGEPAVVVYDTTQSICPTNHSNSKVGSPCHALASQQRHQLAVYPVNTMVATRGGKDDMRTCFGIGEPREPQYTISAAHSHAVIYENNSFAGYQEGCGTLRASGGENGGGSENLFVYDCRGNGIGDVVPTLTGDHENRVTDYTSIVTYGGNKSETLDASYYKGAGSRNGKEREFVAEKHHGRRWIVRRITPIECARLQGFPDWWGIPDYKTEMTDDELSFWNEVRRIHALVNGKKYKAVKADTLLKWYNKLHTDSAEYKMWGNGIALPCAEYVVGGVVKAIVNS